MLALLILIVCAVLAGPGGLCAATAVVALGFWWVKVRARARHRLRVHAELAAALRLVVAELRTGAPTATAAEAVAAETETEVAEVFRRIAVASRLGADVTSALSASPDRTAGGEAHSALERVARAWQLAQRHGVELASLLDSVRRDLDSRVSFTRDVEAKMAGPRATAGVLAALPLLGVLLGEAAGAAPLAVLSGHSIGQVLLVVGVGLLCAGVFWTIRLTDSVVRL